MKALSKIPVERKECSYVLGEIGITADLLQNLDVLKAQTRKCGHGKDKFALQQPRRPSRGGQA